VPDCGAEVPSQPSPPLHSRSPTDSTAQLLAERTLASRAALAGERKLVTVLRDVVGSTSLAEHLGPDVMYRFIERFFEVAAGEVHRFESRITQFAGDGSLGLFGVPISYEGPSSPCNPRRAVLAALAIRQVVHEGGERFGLGPTQRPEIRFGLPPGLVVMGKSG
jgi:adenylate cyclase